MNLLRRILAALRGRPAPHYGGWQDFETGRYVTDPHDEVAALFDIDPDLLGPRGAYQTVEAFNTNAYAYLADPRYLPLPVEDEGLVFMRERLHTWNDRRLPRMYPARIDPTPTEKAMDAIRDAVEEIKLQPWQIEFLRRTAPDIHAHLRSLGVLGDPERMRVHTHNAVRGETRARVFGMPIRVTPLVPRGEVWIEDRNHPENVPYRFSIDETGTVVPKGWT